jgi:FkbM family methyltransferase
LALNTVLEAPVPLALEGLDEPLRMYLHGSEDRHVSAVIREQGQWEPFETRLLLKALGPGDRVLDVGANLGYFSLVAAARVGTSGRVYAFEPEPRNYELLVANVRLNRFEDRVTCCEAGLSDQAGQAQLYLSDNNFGDHQLQPDAPGRPAVGVTLEQGSEWFAGRESQLDFVKVDVQGAEHTVIKGLLPLLQASGDRLRVLLELTPLSLRSAGTSGAALIDTLATLGLPFHIVDHIEHRLVATDAAALSTWCNNVDAVPGDAGFMNILLGPTV